MKMPTLVGIFIFISKENFMLSWAEYEKGFITSEPESGFQEFTDVLVIIILHIES